MTEEEKLQFEQMKRDIETLLQFVEQNKIQQISYPLDNSSTANIALALQKKGYIIT